MTLELTHQIKWKVSEEELAEHNISKSMVQHYLDTACLMRVTEGEPPCMLDDLYKGTKVAFAYINEDWTELHLVYASVTLADGEDAVYYEPDRKKLHEWFQKDMPKIVTRAKAEYESLFPDSLSVKCDYLSACVVPEAGGMLCRIHRNIAFNE